MEHGWHGSRKRILEIRFSIEDQWLIFKIVVDKVISEALIKQMFLKLPKSVQILNPINRPKDVP